MSAQLPVIKNLLYVFVYLAAIAIMAVSILTFIYDKTWLFDLLANFRFHYFIILFLLASILLAGQQYRYALLCYSFAIINFLPLAPYYLTTQFSNSHATAQKSYAKVIRLMTINLLVYNQKYNLIRNAILANKPDILLLVELNTDKLMQLSSIKKILPYSIYIIKQEGYGIAMFSKYPFDKKIRLKVAGQRTPGILASFNINNKTLTVLGIHTHSPVNPNQFHKRNQELTVISRIIAKQSDPKIVMGDLNVTPWSSFFQHFLAKSGLTDSMKGYGNSTTWRSPHTYLSLPIDHILFSNDLVVKHRKVGDNIGSDHYPLIVDFYLT